ncbi:MAG: YihY/virulence factor BrkB family protein [Thermodesulfobacteriota bacterium]
MEQRKPNKVGRTAGFFSQGIWLLDPRDYSRPRGVLLLALRVLVLMAGKFRTDGCMRHAKVLTYYTVMSIVPVLAMGLGLARGFGLDKLYQKELFHWFENQPEVANHLWEFSRNALDQSSNSLIFGAGVIILFWSVFSLLWNMESALNSIRGIPSTRPVPRMIVDYIFAGVVLPFLWLAASGATVYAVAYVRKLAEFVNGVPAVTPAVSMLVSLAPYGVIWVLLAFLYIFLPNGKVRFLPGFASAVLAGSLYVVFQWTYVRLQVGVVKANAVYGSFAAFPLLLIWVQISWAIVMAGAECCFALENASHYLPSSWFAQSQVSRDRTVALFAAHRAAIRFRDGLPPETAQETARALDLPLPAVSRALETLVRGGVLGRVVRPRSAHAAYAPAQDLSRLTLSRVSEAWENAPGPKEPAEEAALGSAAFRRLAVVALALEKQPDILLTELAAEKK